MRRSLQTCRVTARRKPAAYLRDQTRERPSRAAPRLGLLMRCGGGAGGRAAAAAFPRTPPRLAEHTLPAEIKLREQDD